MQHLKESDSGNSPCMSDPGMVCDDRFSARSGMGLILCQSERICENHHGLQKGRSVSYFYDYSALYR